MNPYTTDPYSVGRLAFTVAWSVGAIKRKDYAAARKLLDTELRAFIASPLLSDDPVLREQLRSVAK